MEKKQRLNANARIKNKSVPIQKTELSSIKSSASLHTTTGCGCRANASSVLKKELEERKNKLIKKLFL